MKTLDADVIMEKTTPKARQSAPEMQPYGHIVRMPIADAAMLSSKIVKGAQLKVYPGHPHGMCSTNKDQINADLLAFIAS